VAFGHALLDGHRTPTEREENPVKHAVAVAATVLGSLLGITQTGFWCEWLCDALTSYWARTGEQRMAKNRTGL
jgi:hypothetical protein